MAYRNQWDIPSRLKDGRRVLDAIVEYGVGGERQGSLNIVREMHLARLVLEELISDAIKHGNRLDPAKIVTITCEVTHEKVEVTCRDEGEGFDPDALPDPIAQENLEKPNGRGVFLARAFSEELIYSDNGRCVRVSIPFGPKNGEQIPEGQDVS